MTASITVQGLAEFDRSVTSMRTALPKKIKLMEDEAGDIIVSYAQHNFPRRTGAAVGSIRKRTSARGTVVLEGGPKAPWAPWVDFGGKGRKPGRPAARPFLQEGRYTYKGLRVRRDAITEMMSAGLDELAKSSGLETS